MAWAEGTKHHAPRVWMCNSICCPPSTNCSHTIAKLLHSNASIRWVRRFSCVGSEPSSRASFPLHPLAEPQTGFRWEAFVIICGLEFNLKFHKFCPPTLALVAGLLPSASVSGLDIQVLKHCVGECTFPIVESNPGQVLRWLEQDIHRPSTTTSVLHRRRCNEISIESVSVSCKFLAKELE